jgi:hypothetical protein
MRATEGGGAMVDRAPWQVGGSAPEVYERDLAPAVFGPACVARK